MSNSQLEQQILQQLNQIIQYMDGTSAQIDAMSQSIDAMGKQFAENMASLSENMRLIIEVIKKQRSNLGETLDEMSDQMNEKVKDLWENNTLQKITKKELEAVQKIKELNQLVSDNLYMQQLLSIIQSIRELVGRAQAMKVKKDG